MLPIGTIKYPFGHDLRMDLATIKRLFTYDIFKFNVEGSQFDAFTQQQNINISPIYRQLSIRCEISKQFTRKKTQVMSVPTT